MTKLDELKLNLSTEEAMLLVEAQVAVALNTITDGLREQCKRVKAARAERDNHINNGGK